MATQNKFNLHDPRTSSFELMKWTGKRLAGYLKANLGNSSNHMSGGY